MERKPARLTCQLTYLTTACKSPSTFEITVKVNRGQNPFHLIYINAEKKNKRCGPVRAIGPSEIGEPEAQLERFP
jgi:hypothetical protein